MSCGPSPEQEPFSPGTAPAATSSPVAVPPPVITKGTSSQCWSAPAGATSTCSSQGPESPAPAPSRTITQVPASSPSSHNRLCMVRSGSTSSLQAIAASLQPAAWTDRTVSKRLPSVSSVTSDRAASVSSNVASGPAPPQAVATSLPKPCVDPVNVPPPVTSRVSSQPSLSGQEPSCTNPQAPCGSRQPGTVHG